MNKITESRSQAISLLTSTAQLAQFCKLEEKEKKINGAIERLKRGRTVVLVCGEFKRGKSSFINALIEEPELCPVDIDITTNMATQILYSEEEYVRVAFTKESGKKPVQIPREYLSKYVTEAENKGNQEMVQVVEIGLRKEVLKQNLMMVVDTPGVGSLNAKHSEVTAMYLNYADVILFASDANAPLTTSELEFIKRANKYCNNIFFILTKIDMVRGWKAIEEQNRKKLSELLGKPEDQIKIYPVSSLNKIDYLKTGDEESLEDSRFRDVEDKLMKELQKSVFENMLIQPLQMAKNDVESIKKSFMLQDKAIQEKSQDKKKEIEKKLQDINEKYKTIQKTNSRWQITLGENMSNLKNIIKREINGGFSDLEKNIEIKLKVSEFRNNPDAVNAYIKNSVLDIMRDVEENLGYEITSIKEKILDELGKEIEVGDISFDCGELAEVSKDKLQDERGKTEKVRDFGRNVSINTGAFGAAAAVVGGALGGILGLFAGGVGAVPAAAAGAKLGGILGAAAGSLFGVATHPKELNKRLSTDALKACIAIIRENKALCYDATEKQVVSIVSQIKNDIIRSIQENMETVEKTRKEINKNMNMNMAELAEQSEKIQKNVKSIAALEDKITALLGTLTNGGMI